MQLSCVMKYENHRDNFAGITREGFSQISRTRSDPQVSFHDFTAGIGAGDKDEAGCQEKNIQQNNHLS